MQKCCLKIVIVKFEFRNLGGNMKKSFFASRLISAIFITIVLLHFMTITPSPKILFVPFLICSISMAGENAAMLFKKEKYALIFHKLFVIGFLLFWFGLLLVALYVCIRDKNYKLLIFTLPFWLAGIYVVKNKLLNIKSKKSAVVKINFAIIISAGLVIVAVLAGIAILILGVVRSDVGLIFVGGFFAFGAFTFVLAALMVKGCFDKLKIDVFGMYIGILVVAIGVGFIAIEYGETHSLAKTVQSFGFWIIIPIIMTVAGVFQIVKCLRNRK